MRRGQRLSLFYQAEELWREVPGAVYQCWNRRAEPGGSRDGPGQWRYGYLRLRRVVLFYGAGDGERGVRSLLLECERETLWHVAGNGLRTTGTDASLDRG